MRVVATVTTGSHEFFCHLCTFFCAAWLGEMTTLWSMSRSWTIDGINGIKWADGVYNVYRKDWIEMKQSWWTCWNWWNGKNQINGIDEIDKTVGIRRANEIDGIKRVVVI